MKNTILCLYCIVSLCIISCGKKIIPAVTPTPTDMPKEEKPRLWKQEYFSRFSLSQIDSIRFVTIDTVKFNGKSQFTIISGKVIETDSTIVIQPDTPGKMVNVSRKPGEKERTTSPNLLFESSTQTIPFIMNKDATFSVKGLPEKQLYWYLGKITVVRVLTGVQPQ